jgi:hypothetical protein
MTLAAKALALYQRTRAQYRHLTSPQLLPADHHHLPRPLMVTHPVHRFRAPLRRSFRPSAALRRLLAAALPPPPDPAPPPPPVVLPASLQRPCRICAATVQRP